VRPFLLLIAGLLAYGSLYPFHFEFTSTAGNPLVVLLHGWPAVWTRNILRDLVLNVVIYTPLGFAAAFTFRRAQSRQIAAAAAVACGFFLSVSMELLQVYIPGRDSSLTDLATNTIGAASGAAFALYFEATLRRIGRQRQSRFRTSALLLLVCWTVTQLYPFFPEIGFTHMRQVWAVMLRNPGFSPVETWANCAEWFAAALALDAVFAHMQTSWLAIAMLCLPAQMFIASRSLSVSEFGGAALAFVLWRLVRAESKPRWCAWMLGSAILLRQLQPFYFLAVPQPFLWLPFSATLEAGRNAATVIIARKTFDYGAMIWTLRYAGVPFIWAGLAVAAALGITEAIQTYLPGRSPEITDALLALLMTVALGAMTRRVNQAA
jgi:VanZ family protein